jgi:hypothetical protein
LQASGLHILAGTAVAATPVKVFILADQSHMFGVAKLPFVIADNGFGGTKQEVDRRLKIRAD